jgi:hypothetical protein
MSLIHGPLTAEQANVIYDVLVEHANAWPRGRANFVHCQTEDHCNEYRFQGDLGFGGKFWRANDRWYVTAYPEDIAAQPKRQRIIDETNAALSGLLAAETALAAVLED